MKVIHPQSYRPTVLVPLIVYISLVVIWVRYAFPLKGGKNSSYISGTEFEINKDDTNKAIPPVQLLSSIFLK